VRPPIKIKYWVGNDSPIRTLVFRVARLQAQKALLYFDEVDSCLKANDWWESTYCTQRDLDDLRGMAAYLDRRRRCTK
jgi:hypothetical protein